MQGGSAPLPKKILYLLCIISGPILVKIYKDMWFWGGWRIPPAQNIEGSHPCKPPLPKLMLWSAHNAKQQCMYVILSFLKFDKSYIVILSWKFYNIST